VSVVAVADVAEVNPRVTKRPAEQDPVAFVPMAELDSVAATTSGGDTRPFSEVSKGYTIFSDRDLLVAKITPCFENNKIGQARLNHPVGVGSSEFHVVRPNPELVDERYLLHFLRQDRVRVEGERRMTGSGGQRRVPPAFLKELKLPLPPLDDQRRIAAILDQADALRAKRRQALAYLDDLSQSTFLDMFGDPLKNPLGWDAATIGEVCTRVTDGEHKTPRRSEAGVPLLSARSIQRGWIDFSATDFIDDGEYELLRKRIEPQIDDVLISCSGTIGRVARVGAVSRFAMVRSAALVRPGALVSAAFLEQLLATPSMNRLMNARANSSAQANLFQNQIKALPVVIPPLEAQRRFELRVEQVRRRRGAVVRARVAADELFESLQSGAFAGRV